MKAFPLPAWLFLWAGAAAINVRHQGGGIGTGPSIKYPTVEPNN